MLTDDVIRDALLALGYTYGHEGEPSCRDGRWGILWDNGDDIDGEWIPDDRVDDIPTNLDSLLMRCDEKTICAERILNTEGSEPSGMWWVLYDEVSGGEARQFIGPDGDTEALVLALAAIWRAKEKK